MFLATTKNHKTNVFKFDWTTAYGFVASLKKNIKSKKELAHTKKNWIMKTEKGLTEPPSF